MYIHRLVRGFKIIKKLEKFNPTLASWAAVSLSLHSLDAIEGFTDVSNAFDLPLGASTLEAVGLVPRIAILVAATVLALWGHWGGYT